ncbi:class A beta-lactamase-related serine hydrolase [Rhodohalobacter sp. SW132]|uniref:serine hydrolase domain-containing protein n=1 Tax=Rhodohalobacter sp. SW132 TaxID=2293433 RepID=UPI000E261306|nr:serine hydrolase domain-containing protein [Rhodohalobacter sp. SW132]REL24937.1 class A beta-lactamase-related serine hydrolase [Rhodohalobacter sp. SW132]
MSYFTRAAGTLLVISLLTVMETFSQSPKTDEAWSRVQDHFTQKMNENEVVGGALLFLDENGAKKSSLNGYADLQKRVEVDENTIFHWASITKTLTAIAIMQFRDRDKLSLDDPLTDYLPELFKIHNPYGSMEKLTIRMALNHSTGLRNPTWPWGGNEDWHPFEPTEWSQLVAMFPYTKVEFEPGSRHSYSNPAIIFLGKIIEQSSGDSWESYVHKHILNPLGMNRSYFNHTPEHLLPYRVNSYQIKNGNPEPRGLDFHTGITTSNGGLNAPVTDMIKYLNFLLGRSDTDHPVLERSSLEELWEIELPVDENDGVKLSVGLSFFVEEFDGMRVIGHTGTQWSNYSWFYVHPESGTAVISVTNTDGLYDMHRFRNEMSRYVFEHLFTLYK